jgi:hypothetical protein
VTLHHAKYDKKYKKLHIERVNLKNKRVIGKWSYEIEVKGLVGSQIFISLQQSLKRKITKEIFYPLPNFYSQRN